MHDSLLKQLIAYITTIWVYIKNNLYISTWLSYLSKQPHSILNASYIGKQSLYAFYIICAEIMQWVFLI